MLVAVIAMAGAYQREKKNAENAQNEAVALAENDWVEPETDTTSTGDETQETMAAQTPESQVSDNLSAQTDTTGISQTDPVQGSTDTTALNSQVQTSEEPVMHFSASDTISWPLEGDVILKVDGESITSSSDLVLAIRSHSPNDEVDVTYLRDGKEENDQSETWR